MSVSEVEDQDEACSVSPGKDPGQTCSESSAGASSGKAAAPPLRAVIRRLPPTMTAESLLWEMRSTPPPEHFYFARTNGSISQPRFCRAYVRFQRQEDVLGFKEQFDNRAFYDDAGMEYRAVVEYAPHQGRAPDARKMDRLCGSAETSRLFSAFLEQQGGVAGEGAGPRGSALEYFPVEDRPRAATTPLLEFLSTRQSFQGRTPVRAPPVVSARTLQVIPDCTREKSNGKKKLFNHKNAPPKPEEGPVKSAEDQNQVLEAELQWLMEQGGADDEDGPDAQKSDALGRRKCKFVPISMKRELVSFCNQRVPNFKNKRPGIILGDFFAPNIVNCTDRRIEGAGSSTSCSFEPRKVVKIMNLDQVTNGEEKDSSLKLLVRAPGKINGFVDPLNPRAHGYSQKCNYISN